MPGTKRWKSKIKDHGRVDPKTLQGNPRNWKIHTPQAVAALTASIQELGYIRSVSVNKRTGLILDGHERVALAIENGERLIDVEWVDLSPEDELKALMVFDPISALHEVDPVQFRHNLDEVRFADDHLATLVADLYRQYEGAVTPPPSLDDLQDQHGKYSPEDFWPVLRLRLAPEVYDRYTDLLDAFPGETEGEQFANLLNAVQAP